MKRIPRLFALTMTICAAVMAVAQPRPRIVDGQNTGAFPEVGILLIHASPNDPTVSSLCTGTLIGCRSFLTAAHCVCPFTADDARRCMQQGIADPRELTVLLQHAGRIDVTAVALHPDYSFTERGDVALVTLAEPVSSVAPAVLNGAGRPTIGAPATIVGFGNSGGAQFEQDDFGIKRTGMVTTSLCPTDVEDDAHVCWEFLDVGSNTCGGDSGGPLFVDFGDGPRHAGVTSGGQNPSCLAPDSGFDTDVYVHLDWILEALLASEGTEPCPDGAVVGSDLVTTTYRDGFLERSDVSRTVSLAVPEQAESLLVVLNGALFSEGGFATPNEFGLSLRQAGAPTAACIDSTLGPFDTCRIESPAPGAWEATITRLRGFGEFQLTTTVFLEPTDLCAGDCNDDGTVTADEIATAISLLFAPEELGNCSRLDADGDTVVTASDLVRALRGAAGECSDS